MEEAIFGHTCQLPIVLSGIANGWLAVSPWLPSFLDLDKNDKISEMEETILLKSFLQKPVVLDGRPNGWLFRLGRHRSSHLACEMRIESIVICFRSSLHLSF